MSVQRWKPNKATERYWSEGMRFDADGAYVTYADHAEALAEAERKTNTLRGTSPTAVNSVKTECPQGHQYDDSNTYRDKAGKRYCRKCMNAKHKRLRERKKAER